MTINPKFCHMVEKQNGCCYMLNLWYRYTSSHLKNSCDISVQFYELTLQVQDYTIICIQCCIQSLDGIHTDVTIIPLTGPYVYVELTCLMPWYAQSQKSNNADKNVAWKIVSSTNGIQLSTKNTNGKMGSVKQNRQDQLLEIWLSVFYTHDAQEKGVVSTCHTLCHPRSNAPWWSRMWRVQSLYTK